MMQNNHNGFALWPQVAKTCVVQYLVQFAIFFFFSFINFNVETINNNYCLIVS